MKNSVFSHVGGKNSVKWVLPALIFDARFGPTFVK